MSVHSNRFSENQQQECDFQRISRLLPFFQIKTENSEFQGRSFNKYHLKTFILTLLKTRAVLARSSIANILDCCPISSKVSTFIQELNGVEVKSILIEDIQATIQEFQKLANSSQTIDFAIENSSEHKKTFTLGEISNIVSTFLVILIESATKKLRTKFEDKTIYKIINFKWKMEFIRQFISNFSASCKNGQSIDLEIRKNTDIDQNCKEQLKNLLKNTNFELICEDKALKSKILFLTSKINSQNLSNEILKIFSDLNRKVQQKDAQLKNYQNKVQQLYSIVQQQIEILNMQQMENAELKQEILFSRTQLDQLDRKCKQLQKDARQVFDDFQKFKRSSSETPSYYINPNWEKAQLQQKYFVEIIQLQSDMLLEKNQVKELVKIVLDEIKLSHDAFYQLRANRRFIYRFDKNVATLLGHCKSFDKVNLEEILMLNEGLLLEESDYTQDMYKSSISTFSEESKLRSQLQLESFDGNMDYTD